MIIIIANSKYGAGRDLPGVKRDLSNWARLFPKAVVLENAAAGKIKYALAKYRPDLVIYSGHGAQLVDHRRKLFYESLACPARCAGQLTFLTDTDLVLMRQELGIDMIIDACHSGGLLDGPTPTSRALRVNKHVRSLGVIKQSGRTIFSQKDIRNLRRDNVGRLAAASGKSESAFEGRYFGSYGGLFTLAIMNGLKVKAPSLCDFVEESCLALSRGKQNPFCDQLEAILDDHIK